MDHYETIADYYRAFGHTPPQHPHFDVRPLEQYYQEDQTQAAVFSQRPYRVAFYAIAVLVQGSAARHQGKPFDANVVFYSPYQLLSFEAVPRDWVGYYLMFDQEFLNRCPFGQTLLTDFPFLRLDAVQPLRVSAADVADLLLLFERIHAEFLAARPDRFELIKLWLPLLLHHVKRAAAGLVLAGTDHHNKAEINLVARYQARIEAALALLPAAGAVLSPAHYAAQLAIHPNHLNAVVRRVTGKTAKRLIHDALVARAKALLVQSDQSIKEVAYALGFEEPARFFHLFKKHTALTPAQYRQVSPL